MWNLDIEGVSLSSKLCNFIYLYRSPRQNMEEFEKFVKKFDFNLEFSFNKNLYLKVVFGIKTIRPQLSPLDLRL